MLILVRSGYKGRRLSDLDSIETEFPAIVFDDSLTSNETLSCEPTVSSLNDEIDFRISFDKSNDEDYTVVFDKNSFSYKIISTNDLKTDSENDNEKVNMPLFSLPEPSVSCIDDLDFFKDFENEFPAIVYNDALTSKSDFSTEPTLCPQHIDEFDLNDETSLSKYDEVEQSVLYFNDLFLFNIVYLDDLKSDKGNDDNKIDMIQSLGVNENTNKLLEESHDKIRKVFIKGSFVMELNAKVRFLYFVKSRENWSPRMDTTYGTSTTSLSEHLWLRYQVVGYTNEIVHDFEKRLEKIFGRQVNRVHILDFKGLTPDMRHDLAKKMRKEFMLEFFSTCRIGDEMRLDVAGTICFQLGGARRTISGGRATPEKEAINAKGRKSGARLSKGLVSPQDQNVQSGSCGWCPRAAEDALAVDEGAQADPAPVHAPQPPPPPLAVGRTMT
ncbi:hypothetical protein Tco_0154628 [Tanacetum coccineum]